MGWPAYHWIGFVGSRDISAKTYETAQPNQGLTCGQTGREEQAEYGCHEGPRKFHRKLHRTDCRSDSLNGLLLGQCTSQLGEKAAFRFSSLYTCCHISCPHVQHRRQVLPTPALYLVQVQPESLKRSSGRRRFHMESTDSNRDPYTGYEW